MLSSLVGPVDLNAALVLIAIVVTLCVVITSMIVKRRSRVDLANEHELAKIKQENENNRIKYDLETKRAVQFKQLDQNLITSHKVENPE